MIRKLFLIACLLLPGLVVTLVAVDDGNAADCKDLHEKVRKERTLMVKKELALDALKTCPNHAPIAYQYGYTLERLRKYEDALGQYKKAVKIDPTYAKAYFSVGDIQMLLKNYREAAAAYQIGLQYDSGDQRAQVSLDEARAKYKQVTGKDLPASTPNASAKKKAVAEVEAPKVVKSAPPKQTVASAAVAPVLRLKVPFHAKTSTLSQEAKDVLAVVVGQAMNRPDMKDVKFEIGGHTDNTGDPSENQVIAKKRADEVKRYLVKNFGIAADRLTTASYGQKFPRVPNSSPANKEINRRVEFTKTK